MHDMKGRPLKVGDTVLIPCHVKALHATEDFCNVSLVTLAGRRPNGSKESFSAINTAVLVKADAGAAGQQKYVETSEPA